MAVVNIFLVCLGNINDKNQLPAKLKTVLESSGNAKVVECTRDLHSAVEKLTDDVMFDKMVILPNTFSDLEELSSCLNDIFALILADPTRSTAEVKMIANNEEAKTVFDKLANGSPNFSTLLLSKGERLNPQVLKDFCYNKSLAQEKEEPKKEDNPDDGDDRHYEDYDNGEFTGTREETVSNEDDNDKVRVKHELPDEIETVDTAHEQDDKNSRIGEMFKHDEDNDTEEDEEQGPEEPEEEPEVKEKRQKPVRKPKQKKPLFVKKKKVKPEPEPVEEDEEEEPQQRKKVMFSMKKTRKELEPDDVEEDDEEDEEEYRQRQKRSDIFSAKINLAGSSYYTNESQGLSSNIKSLIAITGDRCSGISSTVANLAHVARVLNNLSVCVVDLDFKFRSLNHYYTRYQQKAEDNRSVRAGLFEAVSSPQAYENLVSSEVDGYDVLSLGFDYRLGKEGELDELKVRENLVEETPINEIFPVTKLTNLLSFLKTKYNIVLVDFPIEYIEYYKNMILAFDRFGICFSNNLRSITNTVMALEDTFPSSNDMYLDTFKSKSSIILTNFNPSNRFQRKSFTQEKALATFVSFSSGEYASIPICGTLVHSDMFDSQLDSNARLICETDEELQESYNLILSELLN